jgi:hypothetical protein
MVTGGGAGQTQVHQALPQFEYSDPTVAES